jgi:hypothetical protein
MRLIGCELLQPGGVVQEIASARSLNDIALRRIVRRQKSEREPSALGCAGRGMRLAKHEQENCSISARLLK